MSSCSSPQVVVVNFYEIPRLFHLFAGILREVPFKRVLLAMLPYLAYLVIFTFYSEIRSFTHLWEVSPPNYVILSNVEYQLFFCHPHQILSQLANPFFDFLAALPYLFHFPLPFLFGTFLAINPRRRPAFYPYVWCAGWVNLLAVLFQTICPTAPPWFTDNTVFDQQGSIVYETPNEAGFRRFDKLIGFSLFHSIYAQAPIKFGSFPSLHIALPVVILLNHPWFGKRVAAVHVVWIALAAMYSVHHYFIDVLGGISLVVIVKYCMLKMWSPFPELHELPRGEEELSQKTAALQTAENIV